METSISYSETVNAPLNKVWQHLLYKIDHPEKFVPHVSDVVVIEKNTQCTIRQMKINMPDNIISIVEKITAIPYIVRFEIIEHPDVRGYVENHAEAINEHTTRLTYTMNWQKKSDNASANNLDILKRAVILSKNYMEENK